MKLIDNAGKWYRLYSAQALAFIAAAQVTLATIPEAWRDHSLPLVGVSTADIINALTVVAALLGFVGRLVAQDTDGDGAKA